MMMGQENYCLKVAKKHGEEALVEANRFGLTDKTLQIHKEEELLFIPLQRKPTETEIESIKAKIPDVQLVTHLFLEKRRQELTTKEVLRNLLPQNLFARFPRALDIVGDIAIIEVPQELEHYKLAVGQAVLKTHKKVRVVLAKASKVGGTYRLRDFELIAGEPRTITFYRENGCSYYVDVAKAFFSPRLSHERERVADLVQEGETVVDLFAGVGPFSILIAKNHRAVRVFSLDINSEAIELMKRNARLNRVENKVFPILGDARKIVNNELAGTADRVIMNLPETAHEYVDVACKSLKTDGGVVHFYGFVRSSSNIENMKSHFEEAVNKTGRKVIAFLKAKSVRETAPFECQAVLDAEII